MSYDGADKKFKVLLVYANKMMENLIPISISVISAVLKEKGYDVKLFDTTYYRTEDECGDAVRVRNLQLRNFDLSKYGIQYKNGDIHKDFRNMVIDYKHTSWSRMTIPEGINKKQLIKWIDEKLTPLEIYDKIHELDASVTVDILYDTERKP